jgi:hypothetical protein
MRTLLLAAAVAGSIAAGLLVGGVYVALGGPVLGAALIAGPVAGAIAWPLLRAVADLKRP